MSIIRCTCTATSKGTNDSTLNWHDVRFHALEHARGCGYSAEVVRLIQTDDTASLCQRWNDARSSINALVQGYAVSAAKTVTQL